MFVADKNIICAGRDPNENDLAAIRGAKAVILAQGCRAALYEMVRNNCEHIFPNFNCRFDYPGKIGQTRLFQKHGVRHPKTRVYEDCEALAKRKFDGSLSMPCVIKQDWGGEGEGVWLVGSQRQWQKTASEIVRKYRLNSGGFLVQDFVACDNRSLRVAVVGNRFQAYWRVQPDKNRFGTNVAQGGIIDHGSDPHLKAAGIKAVKGFCAQTGINLAGFDLLFETGAQNEDDPVPYFLEINYFFGRRGLGGSDRFYILFETAARHWLKKKGLCLTSPESME